MTPRDLWYRLFHALPWRRHLDEEVGTSAARRQLATERLREVNARLDALQTSVGVRTDRRRVQGEEHN